MTFEGIRLVINKGLSNHFFVSHSLLIGATSQTSNYKFGSTFVGTNQVGPGDFSPLLIGDIDPRGNISTNVNVQPWDNVKIKLNTQVIDYIIIFHCLNKNKYLCYVVHNSFKSSKQMEFKQPLNIERTDIQLPCA